MSEESKPVAIVPVGETHLAKPKRWYQRKPKPVPMKKRHYAVVSLPPGTYRESDAPIVEYRAERVEDLSNSRVQHEMFNYLNYRAEPMGLLIAFGLGGVGALLGCALVGPMFGLAGMAVGMTGGMAVAFAALKTLCKKHKEALRAGRPYEDEEIATAVEHLVVLANGDVPPFTEQLFLPVESLFRCLGHDDSVQHLAAGLIVQLPPEVRTAGLDAFAKYLTVEQLALLPGMDSMTPEMVAVLQVGQHGWPRRIDAIPVR